jgi:UDP-glucose 4-epimerase
MSILVTGGAGYIGSHVVDMLVRRGFEVVVLDNLVTGHREAVHPAARFHEADLLDRDAVEEVFRQHTFDGVLHFAGYILVGESYQNPWPYFRDNVLASANLLEAVTAHGIGRFILSSTANLFGSPQSIPIPPDERVDPGSPYGESKHMVERQLHWAGRLYGLTYCCLRYFNAAGAHPDAHIGEDHDPETHLVPRVLQVALGQLEHLQVFGTDYDTPDGTCIRDYVHVMDLAEAHVLALEALADGRSRAYNLGSQRGYSVREVVEVAREVTGRAIPTLDAPRREGDLDVLVASSQCLQTELGWEPKYSDLRQIVETAWEWHRTHPQGYATPRS